jgi:hypothetical protein
MTCIIYSIFWPSTFLLLKCTFCLLHELGLKIKGNHGRDLHFLRRWIISPMENERLVIQERDRIIDWQGLGDNIFWALWIDLLLEGFGVLLFLKLFHVETIFMGSADPAPRILKLFCVCITPMPGLETPPSGKDQDSKFSILATLFYHILPYALLAAHR